MSRRKQPKAPESLSAESKALWIRVTGEYNLLGDTAGEQLLLSLCQNLDRLRQCQQQIAKDGLTIEGASGQIKPHPLLSVEAECRRALLAHFRALRLEPEEL